MWIYGLCLLVVVPAVVLVAQSPEFSNYYPFYKSCSRSWADLIVWEMLYLAQFFALEVFFRGFMLFAFHRYLGSAAVLISTIPFVIMHVGKPEAEMLGAIAAGFILCGISLRSKSIWPGVVLHAGVATTMDFFTSDWWR